MTGYDPLLESLFQHDHDQSDIFPPITQGGGDTSGFVLKVGDTMTGALIIDGSTDTPQNIIIGHTTQTSDYWQVIRGSDFVKLAYIDTSGHFNLANNTNNTPSLKFNPTGGSAPLFIYQRNLALTMGMNGNNVNRILAWFPSLGGDSVYSMELQVYGNNSSFYPLFPSSSVTNTLGRSGNRWNYVYSWRADLDQLIMTGNAFATLLDMTMQSGQSAIPIILKNFSATTMFSVSSAGKIYTADEIEIDGNLNHDGANIGLFGATPSAQSTGWAVTNVTPDKVYDADATTLDEVSDVLGTLITELLAKGFLGA